MARQPSSSGAHTSRRCRVSFETLEDRRVLASAWPTSVLYLGNVYDQYTSDLQNIELKSKATPAQLQALTNDARAISASTSSATVGTQSATAIASAVTLQLDRSTLDGWIGDRGWQEILSRLEPNLQTLGASPTLIQQTVSDMQAIAKSARVSSAEYTTFTNDFNNLRSDETLPGASSYNYTDPQYYFAQHLLGFFRGGVVNRVADRSELTSDIHTLSVTNTPAPIINRDVKLLESLGAAVPNDTFAAIVSAYGAALPEISTSADALKSTIIADLGNAATHARTNSVTKLIADAPAFYQALGASPDNVQTLLADVQTVVDDGIGASPDPFKVTVVAK